MQCLLGQRFGKAGIEGYNVYRLQILHCRQTQISRCCMCMQPCSTPNLAKDASCACGGQESSGLEQCVTNCLVLTLQSDMQATVCAKFGLECIVYMGAKDMERQKLNVFRMRLLGADVRPVHAGTSTLKDATSEAIRDWVTNVETTHYILGSAAGPHPYPMMVRMCTATTPIQQPLLYDNSLIYYSCC